MPEYFFYETLWFCFKMPKLQTVRCTYIVFRAEVVSVYLNDTDQFFWLLIVHGLPFHMCCLTSLINFSLIHSHMHNWVYSDNTAFCFYLYVIYEVLLVLMNSIIGNSVVSLLCHVQRFFGTDRRITACIRYFAFFLWASMRYRYRITYAHCF